MTFIRERICSLDVEILLRGRIAIIIDELSQIEHRAMMDGYQDIEVEIDRYDDFICTGSRPEKEDERRKRLAKQPKKIEAHINRRKILEQRQENQHKKMTMNGDYYG